MPVLNYHRDEKDMPDMSQPQKCDKCGGVQIGNQMYYSYSKKKIGVICRSCFASTPPNKACTGRKASVRRVKSKSVVALRQ